MKYSRKCVTQKEWNIILHASADGLNSSVSEEVKKKSDDQSLVSLS